MDTRLQDRPVLVLASSAGIGKAIALAFAREGASVMLFGRDEGRLRAARDEIATVTGRSPRFTVGDVTRADDLASAVEQTVHAYGSLFTLVNNCGGPPPGRFDQTDDAAWQAAFELTLLSYVRATRHALAIMRDHGGGRVINVSSSSTKRALDNLLLSNVFRMGVLGLTKSLAMELGPDGVLVNTVGAGKVLTDRVRQIDRAKAERQGVSVERLRAQAEAAIPLGRYGDPDEFARLCVFLGSPANSYVTGQNILVDGGQVAAY